MRGARRHVSLATVRTAYHAQQPSSVLALSGLALLQGAPATLPQIRDVARHLRARQSETGPPCDRCEPDPASSFQAGERHALPGAPLCSALTPDSLQSVPGLLA